MRVVKRGIWKKSCRPYVGRRLELTSFGSSRHRNHSLTLVLNIMALGLRTTLNRLRPPTQTWIYPRLPWMIPCCRLRVCRKPIDLPNPTQPNSTRRVGLVFKAWWVGLGYKKIFYSGSGWVWVIKLQTRQTRPDSPIFNIYLKYII